MIDGFRRAPRRPDILHPEVKKMTDNIVIGDHSGDRFVPPTEVAAAEEQKAGNSTAGNLLTGQAYNGFSAPPPSGPGLPATPPSPYQPQPPKKRSFKNWLKNLSTKQKILLTLAAAIVVAGGIIGAYLLFFAPEKPQPKPAQKQQPQKQEPTTVASNLTGVQVDPTVNERPVTAVMIENSVVARPQSGLQDAGVVFEAIAEGGITRFVALYQDNEPKYVGPVRSARPYFMQWMLGFDAAYAHAGGSAQALSLINKWKVKDLNHHQAYFWRVSNRAAPHNLYTSIPKLQEYQEQKGYGKSNYTPLPRKEKESPASTPTVKTIDFNISSANFNVHYDYDPENNFYKRSVGGARHTDERSRKQLRPKVVVALIMPQGKNGIYYTYRAIGSGQVLIFQDGKVYKGTWRKKSNTDNLTFTDASGNELKLNPGQTWFTAVGDASRVKYGS